MLQDIPQNNSIWKKNLAALRERDAGLCYRLIETELNPDNYKYQIAKDRNPVLGVKQPDGKFYPLDDPYVPKQRADEWLQKIDSGNLYGGHVTIVGVCTGFHILSLYNNMREGGYLWVVEPDCAAIKAAFHLLDFSAAIASSSVRFVAGEAPERVAAMPFDGVTGNRMRAAGVLIQSPPAAYRLYRGYVQNLVDSVQRASEMESVKIETMEAQGRYVLRNSVANLPAILKGAPVLRLRGTAAGTPAVVVGPAPSLEESLPLLREMQDRVLIVAVDTALRSLQRSGVHPDVIVSVDFSDLNARHFEGVSFHDAVLVSSPAVHSSITERYAGRTFFFTHHATRFVRSLKSLHALGDVHVLGSTAYAAYRIARDMGCSPIVFVGIDLALTGGRQYAEGAIQNDIERPETDPKSLIEIPSNDGTTVKTTAQFKMFRDALSQIIVYTKGDVINASKRGAQIQGCPYKSLENVASVIPLQPFDKSFLQQCLAPNLSSRERALKDELTALREAFQQFDKTVGSLIERTRKIDSASETFSKNMNDCLEEFFGLQKQSGPIFNLCTPLCPYTTILLYGAPEQFSPTDLTPLESRDALKNKLISAFTDFYNAVRQNVQALQKMDFI